MEVKNNLFIVLIVVLLIVPMNNSIIGQIIKLDAIYVELYQEIKQKDTLYYPYEIGYEMSVYNDFEEFSLIIGAYHYYPRGKYKNGVFRVNINGTIIDLQNRREQLFLVPFGDTLHLNSELYNKVLLLMAFKKEDLKTFTQSLKNIKITYCPVVKDYPDIVGTYFIKQEYEVIIEDPEIAISNEELLR